MPHARKVDIPLSQRGALSVAETAAILGLAQSTIYKLIKTKQLRTEKILGRRLVLPAAVNELLTGGGAAAEEAA